MRQFYFWHNSILLISRKWYKICLSNTSMIEVYVCSLSNRPIVYIYSFLIWLQNWYFFHLYHLQDTYLTHLLEKNEQTSGIFFKVTFLNKFLVLELWKKNMTFLKALNTPRRYHNILNTFAIINLIHFLHIFSINLGNKP